MDGLLKVLSPYLLAPSPRRKGCWKLPNVRCQHCDCEFSSSLNTLLADLWFPTPAGKKNTTEHIEPDPQ